MNFEVIFNIGSHVQVEKADSNMFSAKRERTIMSKSSENHEVVKKEFVFFVEYVMIYCKLEINL